MRYLNEQTGLAIHKYLLPINRRINRLNQGGCGVFAVAFAKAMISLGYEPRIVGVTVEDYRYNYRPEDNQSNENNIEYMRLKVGILKRTMRTYYHYMVEVDGYYFDSESFARKNRHGLIDGFEDGIETEFIEIGNTSLENLEYLSNLSFQWNNNYDRMQNGLVKQYVYAFQQAFENQLQAVA